MWREVGAIYTRSCRTLYPSNEQRATSHEQRATSNEQRATEVRDGRDEDQTDERQRQRVPEEDRRSAAPAGRRSRRRDDAEGDEAGAEDVGDGDRRLRLVSLQIRLGPRGGLVPA